MKKKELLIIFVLAILVTGGSWFWEVVTVGLRNDHGFPLKFYWREWGGRSGPLIFSTDLIIHWNCLYLLLNSVFWFLIFVGGWWVVGKLKKRLMKK